MAPLCCPDDLSPILAADLRAGLPAWIPSSSSSARRTDDTPPFERASVATSAEYGARGQVTAAMLTTPQYGRPAPSLPTVYFAAVPDSRRNGGITWKPVQGFSCKNGTVRVQIDGEYRDASDLKEMITYEQLLQTQANRGMNGSVST